MNNVVCLLFVVVTCRGYGYKTGGGRLWFDQGKFGNWCSSCKCVSCIYTSAYGSTLYMKFVTLLLIWRFVRTVKLKTSTIFCVCILLMFNNHICICDCLCIKQPFTAKCKFFIMGQNSIQDAISRFYVYVINGIYPLLPCGELWSTNSVCICRKQSD